MSEHETYIGRLINDRYRLEAKLGSGGYGMVYRATDTETGERVALKLLRDVIASDPRVVARFRREGTVLFRLRNPHTVVVHEFAYTADGIFYLAMELLEGKSLKRVVRKEAPITWQRMLTILSQICEALSEAHAAGVIHRDLKPENIYLIERPDCPEFVKILDFGIAKFLDGGGLGQEYVTQLTGRGRTVGTIRYMSPEQILGRGLDGRSDIYTLGVVMYRLLTARMPFPGAYKAGALIAAQLASPPKPPSTMREGLEIPGTIDRLILRMLEKEPKKRFADVDELYRACNSALASGEWEDPTTDLRVPRLQGPLRGLTEHLQVDFEPEEQAGPEQTGDLELLDSADIQLVTEDTVDETGVTEAQIAAGKRGKVSGGADTVEAKAVTDRGFLAKKKQ